MADGPWTTADLPEVIDFKEGPGIMARDFRDTGVPLVRLAGLSARSLLSGCNYLEPDAVERKWAHFRLETGDTVISTSASLGRIALVGPEAKGAIPYTGIIRMRPRDGRLHADFLPYLLRAPDFQRQAEAMGAGSVMRHFGPSHLRDMTVAVPPPEDQKRIASVLGALGGKIECNGRLIGVLAQISVAEFQARFTDHTSVRRMPRDESDGSASDWQCGSLVDLAEFVNGKALTKMANGRGRPVIRIREMNGGIRGDTPRTDADVADQHIARDGDILFAWSGSLDVYRWSGPEALINQHIFKVLPKSPYSSWFVYEWIREHMARFQAIARDKATTMGHIQRRHLVEAAVPLPPASALDAARRVLDPIDRQRVLLARENATLTAIRDALLPKLVSGQIRVPDTADPEEVIGPVAEEVAA